MLGNSVTEMEVQALLEFFRDARLMAEMDERYLSLAVWRNRAAAQMVANTPSTEISQESRSPLTVI